MASFKLCVADTKSGKSYQKEVQEAEAKGFIGLNIGEAVKGDDFGLAGYECVITGGSDHCGFPMRRGIMGVRKKIAAFGGVGFPGLKGGTRKRKTVCGHKIHGKIAQINLKVTKAGGKKLEELMPSTPKEGGEGKEAPKEEKKDAPKEEAKEAPKEEAKEAPKEESKDAADKPKEESKGEKA